MAVDPSVRIDIAAEFTGRKAFKQADTSTAQLTKNVKNLAKTFGVAFSTAKVLAYAKASVRAAAADQKAQQQLALALKNVGLERDAATAEGYIQRIEKEFGIIDDKLRPAYSRLAIATRDSAETQRLMGIAMDISANTGKDLEAVTQALSKAYLGNNTTLSKLNIGISKADLSTKSFQEITDQLAITFAGAAKSSADTFSGSMDKLAIASNNAKEIIGTSLIGALQSLGQDDSMATLSTSIEGAATSLANFIDSVVYLKKEIASIPGAGIISGAFGLVGSVLGKFSPQRLAELVKAIKGFQGMGNVSMTGGSNQDTQKYLADQKKIADAKIKADKDASAKKALADKLAAAKKLKADKEAAANLAKLSQAAALFDLDRIQIEAALKGKINEEEKTRLLLMQAVLEEDASTAENLAKKLADIQKINFQIAADLAIIAATKDPFSSWAGSLSLALVELGKYNNTLADVPNIVPGVNYNPNQNADRNYDQKVAAVTGAIELLAAPPEIAPTTNMPTPTTTTNNPLPSNDLYGFSLPDYLKTIMGNPTSGLTAPAAAPAPITINIEGSVLDGDDFSEKVNNAVLNNIRRGYSQFPAGAIPTP
jgi:hypothetical protein